MLELELANHFEKRKSAYKGGKRESEELSPLAVIGLFHFFELVNCWLSMPLIWCSASFTFIHVAIEVRCLSATFSPSARFILRFVLKAVTLAAIVVKVPNTTK